MRIYKNERILVFIFSSVAVLLFALAIFLPMRGEKEPEIAVGQFVLLLSEVDEALQPRLHMGDRVIDRQNRRVIGDISNIRSETSRREIFSEQTGKLTLATVPGKYDLFLTLTAEQKNGAVFTVSGEPVRLGQIYYLRTYDFTGEGRVVELL